MIDSERAMDHIVPKLLKGLLQCRMLSWPQINEVIDDLESQGNSGRAKNFQNTWG